MYTVGTALEKAAVSISARGVLLGVASSITTAAHAIIIKQSLKSVKGTTLDLVYYNNLLSVILLLPLLILSGELTNVYHMIQSSLNVWYGMADDLHNLENTASLFALLLGGLVTVPNYSLN